MAIHTEETRDIRGGFDKELEASALPMILDNLQIYQYQYPVKSTIRELVSNGVDSIKERDIAKKILTGEAQEEDFYIRRDDPLFKDSNFDPSYYDLDWLSDTPNVTIIYQDGGELGKDYIKVVDNGVGIGGKRLAGYMKLGWSSKRNSKTPLGKFGIGAKAGLSTGVKFYTVFSYYNGMEFRFNIYAQSIESIVPAFNLDTNKPNPSIELTLKGTTQVVHYIPTSQKNGVEVILETKRHKKQEFIEAVKSQLLYFKNVRLIQRKPDGYTEEIKIQPGILYEDDNLILSDNNQYSKPHMVINGVNYGYVDFDELELEQKSGNIGIKVSQEDVSINPSRESVVWDDQTRQAVLRRFKDAADSALGLVQEALQTTDFVRWIQTYNTITIRYNSQDTAIGRLANLVDLNKLPVVFLGDANIAMEDFNYMFPGMNVDFVIAQDTKDKGRTLLRSEIASISTIRPDYPLFITGSPASTETLEYLASIHTSGFVLIQYLPAYKFDSETYREVRQKMKLTLDALSDVLDDRRRRVIKLLEESSIPVRLDSITVPEGFVFSSGKVQMENEKKPSPEELRKLNEEIVFFTPRTNRIESGDLKKPTVMFTWHKVEPKLKLISELHEGSIYYGTNDQLEYLQFAAILGRPLADMDSRLYNDWSGNDASRYGVGNSYRDYYLSYWGPKANLLLVKIAKGEIKNFSKHKSIDKFFVEIKDGVLGSSNLVISWYTAKLIQDQLDRVAFLKNYQIDPTMKSKYALLSNYVSTHYRDMVRYVGRGYLGLSQEKYDEFITLMERKTIFQLYKRDNPAHDSDSDELSQSLFGTKVIGAVGVDLVMYDLLQEVLEYAKPLAPLFNKMQLLTSGTGTIPEETEAAIREYLNFRGIS